MLTRAIDDKGPAMLDNTGYSERGYRRQTEPGPSTSTPSEHLIHYLRVLYRRRRLALLTFLVVAGGVMYFSLTATPMYEAKAQLMIEVGRPRVVLFNEQVERNDDANQQETQRRVLQSRTLAYRTIDSLKLWQYPELGGTTSDPAAESDQPSVGRLRSLMSSVASWLVTRVSRLPAPDTLPEGVFDPDAVLGLPETPEQSRVIDAFLGRLTVSEVGQSRLAEVKFRSVEPKAAAAIVNALAQAYIQQNRDFKAKAAEEDASWLAEQLEEHRKQVEKSQAALQRYREQSPQSSGEGESLIQRRLDELNGALIRARTERIQKEALYNQVKPFQQDLEALDSMPVIRSNPDVQRLRGELSNLQQQDLQLQQNLGERHPERLKLRAAIQEARGALAAEMSAVAESIRKELVAAQAQEESLLRAVESQRREAFRAMGNVTEYAALERAARADEQIFETLLQRTKETGVTESLTASNIRIVDTASVPGVPVSPNHRRDLLIALLGGAFAAIGAAFFMDYMDKTIKSPNEIKTALGLPCLGLVPVAKHGSGHDSPLIHNGVPPIFREAFRGVRTNVLFTSADEKVKTILVTSTGPNEGKTVVASNLAISLAQTKQRVVLIDADMRRPRVHQVFGVSQEPGLVEVVDGRAKPSRVILQSDIPDLWILPSGAIPANPAELLSSSQFKQFIEVLGQSFDWVIIDSPPVMAVTDAALVANVVAGVLFVLGAEQATSPMALNALDQLEAARARFVGAVLNKVNLKGDSFFYGDYYQRSYTNYYSKTAE
jgi:capsular exopolysaccharide synthesis family protein